MLLQFVVGQHAIEILDGTRDHGRVKPISHGHVTQGLLRRVPVARRKVTHKVPDFIKPELRGIGTTAAIKLQIAQLAPAAFKPLVRVFVFGLGRTGT